MLVILGFCVCVVLFASARLRQGLSSTLDLRLQTIFYLRLYVGTSVLYWTAAASFYAALYVTCYEDGSWLWGAMAAVIAGKGLVDTAMWHLTARHRRIDDARLRALSSKVGADGAIGGDASRATELQRPIGAYPAEDDQEQLLQGVNAALREEWLEYTTLGITRAVAAADAAFAGAVSPPPPPDPNASQGSHRGASSREIERRDLLLPPIASDGTLLPTPPVPTCGRWCYGGLLVDGPPFPFVDYHPEAFRQVRAAFGLSAAVYVASLASASGQLWLDEEANAQARRRRWTLSEGKSGAFMYFTADRKLLVKTLDPTEFAVLARHAPAYCGYLVANPATKLPRFYGLHSIRMYNSTMYDGTRLGEGASHMQPHSSPHSSLYRYIVVMSNVFGAAEPRAAGEPLMDERYDLKGSWVNRTSTEPKNPSVLKKDNDLVTRVHLTSRGLHRLRTQLTRDVEFLENEMRVTDYSLLLGVRKGRFCVETQGDGRTTFRPYLPPGTPGSAPRPQSPSSCSGSATPVPDHSGTASLKSSMSTAVAADWPTPPFAAAATAGGAARLPAVHSSSTMAVATEAEPAAAAPAGGAAADADAVVLSVGCASSERSYNSSSNVRTSRSDGPRNSRSDGAGPPGREGGVGGVGGVSATMVEGAQSYYMGIIDVLQPWGLSKRAEQWAKWLLCYDVRGVSAAPPAAYAARFRQRVVTDCFDAPLADLAEGDDDREYRYTA